MNVLKEVQTYLREQVKLQDMEETVAYHLQNGEREEALYFAGLATDFFPRSPQSWLLKAKVLACFGEFYQVDDYCDVALQINTCNASTWNKIGLIYAAHGRHDNAEQFFRQAIKYDRLFAEAYQNCFLSQLAQGDLAKARQTFVQLISINETIVDKEILFALADLVMDEETAENNCNEPTSIS